MSVRGRLARLVGRDPGRRWDRAIDSASRHRRRDDDDTDVRPRWDRAIDSASPRRRRWSIAVAGLAATCAFAGSFAATTAFALWRDTVEVTVASGLGSFGVTVQRNGGDPIPLTDLTAGVRLNLTPADAAQLLADPAGLAIPFTVNFRADGHLGLAYALRLDNRADGTVFGASRIDLVRVGSPSDCATNLALATWSNQAIPAIETVYAPVKTATHHYCLRAVLDPSRLGRYENTATLTATGPNAAPVTADDTWSAIIAPDPTQEPTTGVLVLPEVHRPDAQSGG